MFFEPRFIVLRTAREADPGFCEEGANMSKVALLLHCYYLSPNCTCIREKIPAKINYKEGWPCKKHRNKAGIKIKDNYPATE